MERRAPWPGLDGEGGYPSQVHMGGGEGYPSHVWTGEGTPHLDLDGGRGYPSGPGQGGYPSQVQMGGYPKGPGMGYPPLVRTTEEYSLCGGRYVSCVHAGGLSCY